MLIKLLEEVINFKLCNDTTCSYTKNLKIQKFFKSIEKVVDKEYTKSLNFAKISLNFFSKLNNDLFTIQCFEIPACNRL